MDVNTEYQPPIATSSPLTEASPSLQFQVDLWSLGVVAYTLLVGRPPYECKDIRSTYKRILANSYCFPPTVPLSEHARHFVRSLLQVCLPSTSAVLKPFLCG